MSGRPPGSASRRPSGPVSRRPRPAPRSGHASSSPSTPQSDRGLSPVVGKTLELGVGVMFVALLTATLFGGLVPEYRAAVGAELGDRTLVGAADRVEAAAPAVALAEVDRSVTVQLPETIRGDPYRIVAETNESGSALALAHPDESVGGRVRLALPAGTTVRGAWRSTSPSRAVVRGTDGTITVTLADGGRRAEPPSATPEGQT